LDLSVGFLKIQAIHFSLLVGEGAHDWATQSGIEIVDPQSLISGKYLINYP